MNSFSQNVLSGMVRQNQPIISGGATTHNQVQKNLHQAAFCGDLARVKQILEMDPSEVHLTDREGRTPLHYAAVKAHTHVVRFLLDNGAGVFLRDRYKVTPFGYAIRTGDMSLVKSFKPDQVHFCSAVFGHDLPLIVALAAGKIDIAKWILRESPDSVMEYPFTNQTPLHYAVSLQDEELFDGMLKKGADVNAQDRDGLTPLHFAAAIGNKAQVLKLIDKGADVNAEDLKGRTPLHRAAEKVNQQVMEVLIKRGAKVTATSRDSSTVLSILAANSSQEALNIHRMVKGHFPQLKRLKMMR